MLGAEAVLDACMEKFGVYLYDEKLKSLTPGYVAETGILLATEPSTMKFFSYDYKHVLIEKDESWEPIAPVIDTACLDSTKGVKISKKDEYKPTSPNDDIESIVMTEQEDKASVTRKRPRPSLKVSKNIMENALASKSQQNIPTLHSSPRRVEPELNTSITVLSMVNKMKMFTGTNLGSSDKSLPRGD